MPVARVRPLRRTFVTRFGLLLAAGLAVTGLTACTSDGQVAEDAYKVGCPAVDTALAGGSVANAAAIRALEAARDSGQLDPEPTTWVNAAITVLNARSTDDIPADAKKLVVDGCADNGYPLQNLR